MISKEKKSEIIAAYSRKPGDTGSPEVQIAILSERFKGQQKRPSFKKRTFKDGW